MKDTNRNLPKNSRKLTFLLVFLCLSLSCAAQPKPTAQAVLQTGAMQTTEYLHLLKGKKVGLVVNQTAIIGKQHLVDSLLAMGVEVAAIFAPEHGFRGEAEAGAEIKDGRDPKTGIRVVSLYGNKKKPRSEDLQDIEMLVFDIQDVGARFYTYISTLHYVMEACAEHSLPLLILDRPNPNGHYVDGPVLDTAFRSFVGMHPIPVVHGMTIGEYAGMIAGEKWLPDGLNCDFKVVKMKAYTHKTRYTLPVAPSPNLPNMFAIYLYPSICFFEGTPVSLGRGTNKPFQQIGAPWFSNGKSTFIPKAIAGKALNPPFKDEMCRGYDLSQQKLSDWESLGRLRLDWLLEFYAASPEKTKFFIPFFDKLAGTDELRKQIVAGKSEAQIRQSWQKDLAAFKITRSKYLLYPDFE